MQLNTNEENVLRALAESSDGNGHDFGFTDDVDFAALGLSRHQYAGYVDCNSIQFSFSLDAFYVDCNSIQFSFSLDAFRFLGLENDEGWRFE
jgi:hypothetical protein